jgi:hypothetical protein
MLTNLKDNSQYRLDHHPDFKIYLSRLQQTKGEFPMPASRKENWGVQDLQMAEVTDILKDMIFKQSALPIAPHP